MSPRPVARCAALQIETPDTESKVQRLQRVSALIRSLPAVDLILLPEIWTTGYFTFDRYAADAEDLAGETVAILADAARDAGAYLLAGSMVERAGDALYNTSLLFNPAGELAATYRKIHLFGYGSLETQILTPGRDIVTVPTPFGVLGLSTCYDLRFPELYRAQVDRGAEMFLVVSAWPFPRLEHWLVLNRARAIENQAYVISCNCAGLNGGSRLLGHSMVTNPWGTVIAGTDDRTTVLHATLDPGVVNDCRAEFPPLRDRVLK